MNSRTETAWGKTYDRTDHCWSVSCQNHTYRPATSAIREGLRKMKNKNKKNAYHHTYMLSTECKQEIKKSKNCFEHPPCSGWKGKPIRSCATAHHTSHIRCCGLQSGERALANSLDVISFQARPHPHQHPHLLPHPLPHSHNSNGRGELISCWFPTSTAISLTFNRDKRLHSGSKYERVDLTPASL